MIFIANFKHVKQNSASHTKYVRGETQNMNLKELRTQLNLTQAALAKELGGYGIRVNAVAPGFIQTEMIDAIPAEKREEYVKQIPLKRFGTADEVANLVSAIASDEFAYVTGQVFVLDGGLSL